MARKVKEKAAVQPAQGKKITFGEADDFDGDVGMEPGPSRRPVVAHSDQEDDSDDAPEAVEQSTARHRVQQDADNLASFAQAKKEAKAVRAKAIKEQKALRAERAAAAKSANRPNAPGAKKRRRNQSPSDASEDDDESASGSEDDADVKRLKKRMEASMEDADNDESSEEDEADVIEAETAEEKRLRQRMEAAMAQADDESEDDEASDDEDLDGEDEDEDENEDEDDLDQDEEGEEGASFHTASDGDDDEDDDEQDDESEILEDGPLDDHTRMMRAKMQEMMEAAERRALGPRASTKPKAVKSALKNPSVPAPPATKALEDDSQFDLSPHYTSVKPLSAKAIKAAAQAEREEKERARILSEAKKRKAAERERKEKKEEARKKARREQEGLSTRQIGENKAVQILQPLLQSSGGLPPVLDPSQRVRGVNKTHKKFMKTAMKSSGTMTSKGWKSGRK